MIASNLKCRLSGVTATVVLLIPVPAAMIGIVTTGSGLPPDLPHMPLARLPFLRRDHWRVWHARRNTEMALGLILRHVLQRKLPPLDTYLRLKTQLNAPPTTGLRMIDLLARDQNHALRL